jgi:hypothetical protein
MRRITLMLIPNSAQGMKQLTLPSVLLKFGFFASLVLVCGLGFMAFDYYQLRAIRTNYHSIISENQHLKGEAQILLSNLENVKGSLRQVNDYTGKLGDLVSIRVNTVSKKTGIGPLSPEEFKTSKEMESGTSSTNLPVGINIDQLAFRPVLDRLSFIGSEANRQALELQHLLSTLTEKKSMLASIPSIRPANGWITSNFGKRISPFTAETSWHQGIDVAAQIGTPIYAPADGVVIFSGSKAGFGNFIMIAHGYGLVTRYGHNAQNMVQAGQRILRGEQLATVGNSGRTTGPHLHYEVWLNGRAVNPIKFILD